MTDNLLLSINELGADADLLTRHDGWLEQQRAATQTRVNDCVNELRSIILAQRIKKELQQENLVALQEAVTNSDRITDIIIKITSLPNALKNIATSTPTDRANTVAQIYGWHNDGYDINAI